MVCCVQTDDRGEKRPGTKSTTAKTVDWRSLCALRTGVNFLGVSWLSVCLDAVADGDDGDL